jgi:hypothetical protein
VHAPALLGKARAMAAEAAVSNDPSPPSLPPLGPALVGVGALIALVGLLVWSGALRWFGKLPGDIRYESDSVRVYVPIVSMLLVSVAMSAVAFVVRRLL